MQLKPVRISIEHPLFLSIDISSILGNIPQVRYFAVLQPNVALQKVWFSLLCDVCCSLWYMHRKLTIIFSGGQFLFQWQNEKFSLKLGVRANLHFQRGSNSHLPVFRQIAFCVWGQTYSNNKIFYLLNGGCVDLLSPLQRSSSMFPFVAVVLL
jgi:hypothetical protein